MCRAEAASGRAESLLAARMHVANPCKSRLRWQCGQLLTEWLAVKCQACVCVQSNSGDGVRRANSDTASLPS